MRAWPTQVLIDPAGYVIGAVSGEGNYELIDQVVAKAVAEFRKTRRVERRTAEAGPRARQSWRPTAGVSRKGFWRMPKVIDYLSPISNHNRLVVTKLDGTFLETIGTGAAGAADGAFC